MAPDGACEVARSTAPINAHMAQFEAFERDFEVNTKALPNTTSLARAAIPSSEH